MALRFTSEQRLDDGVLERVFTLGEVPGILWTPTSASTPAPLILLGHPGGLHKMYPRLVARARHSAAVVEVPTDRDAAGPWVPAGGTSRFPPTSPTSARTSTPAPAPRSNISDQSLGKQTGDP